MADHGTRSNYNAGCRCIDCVQANRDYSNRYNDRRAREAERLGKVANNRKHGVIASYNAGCRCERCTAAEAEKHQRRRLGMALGRKPSLPVQPLLDRVSRMTNTPIGDLDIIQVANTCGVTRETASRWMRTGLIPEPIIDDLSIHLGWHPAAIWGVDWYIETYDTLHHYEQGATA